MRGQGSLNRSSVTGVSDLVKMCCDLIEEQYANSNRFHPYFKRLDGSVLVDDVVEWTLYGFVRGHHVDWGSSWVHLSRVEISNLEDKGYLERR